MQSGAHEDSEFLLQGATTFMQHLTSWRTGDKIESLSSSVFDGNDVPDAAPPVAYCPYPMSFSDGAIPSEGTCGVLDEPAWRERTPYEPRSSPHEVTEIRECSEQPWTCRSLGCSPFALGGRRDTSSSFGVGQQDTHFADRVEATAHPSPSAGVEHSPIPLQDVEDEEFMLRSSIVYQEECAWLEICNGLERVHDMKVVFSTPGECFPPAGENAINSACDGGITSPSRSSSGDIVVEQDKNKCVDPPVSRMTGDLFYDTRALQKAHRQVVMERELVQQERERLSEALRQMSEVIPEVERKEPSSSTQVAAPATFAYAEAYGKASLTELCSPSGEKPLDHSDSFDHDPSPFPEPNPAEKSVGHSGGRGVSFTQKPMRSSSRNVAHDRRRRHIMTPSLSAAPRVKLAVGNPTSNYVGGWYSDQLTKMYSLNDEKKEAERMSRCCSGPYTYNVYRYRGPVCTPLLPQKLAQTSLDGREPHPVHLASPERCPAEAWRPMLRWDSLRSGNVLLSEFGDVCYSDTSQARQLVSEKYQQGDIFTSSIVLPMYALGTFGTSHGQFRFNVQLSHTTAALHSRRSHLQGVVAAGTFAVGLTTQSFRGTPQSALYTYLYRSNGSITASLKDTLGVPYGRTYGSGAEVAVHLDLDHGELSFAVDNVPMGVAFRFQPCTDPETLVPVVVFGEEGSSAAFVSSVPSYLQTREEAGAYP